MATKLVARSLTGLSRLFQTVAHRSGFATTVAHTKPHKNNHKFYYFGGISFTVLAAGIPDSSKDKKVVAAFESKKKLNLKDYDPETFSQSYLMKMASNQTVDSVSSLLTQVCLALMQAEKDYAEAVNALNALMKGKLQLLEGGREEEQIWDLILECRDLVSRNSQKQQDLQMIMLSVEKIVEATAEVSYLVGTEEAGTMMCERLYSVQSHIQDLRRKSLDAEDRLRKIEAAAVMATTQRSDRRMAEAADFAEGMAQEDTGLESDKTDSQTDSESGFGSGSESAG